MEPTAEQPYISPAEHLRPYQYKKGQSGNPSGRPKGSVSLKQYLKNKLGTMTEEEREEFLDGIDKIKIWEMAEGKAEAKINGELTGDLVIKLVSYKDGNNDTPQISAS